MLKALSLDKEDSSYLNSQGHLIRSLSVTCDRITSPSDFQWYIESYISVQVNLGFLVTGSILTLDDRPMQSYKMQLYPAVTSTDIGMDRHRRPMIPMISFPLARCCLQPCPFLKRFQLLQQVMVHPRLQ